MFIPEGRTLNSELSSISNRPVARNSPGFIALSTRNIQLISCLSITEETSLSARENLLCRK
jgi:hypothetical protein